MKKANSIRKKKEPAKPKHCIVHLRFENKNELDNLELIKKLTGMTVGTKAVIEALANYPNVSKRADALNSELQKTNREFETMQMKLETVKRAFKIINEDSEQNNLSELNLNSDSECSVCGCDDFDDDGDCEKCGQSKYE